jgi:ATP-dependent DNA helicase RecQ
MKKHLKEVYGFNNFRHKQKNIICDLIKKKNIIAILPTGGGKSLLYQYPATFTNKITIVVSPLISLMNDQCRHLNLKNIKAVSLNSETFVPVNEYKNYKIIYTTPEFIMSRMPAFNLIKDKIGLFAIDEAHCVSQWSHDFRTSYQNLGMLKTKFPDIPMLAVTATATPNVLKEMKTFLNMANAEEYSLGTRRTNLNIKVLPKSEFKNCIINEPTIIYVQTRKLCEKLHNDFINKGIASAFYHGGMEKAEKNKSHELFMSDKIKVIVATISFGMGIDKSDIRHVINYGVPANIESYYQEIGRAGRDGIDSRATIYYKDSDFSTTSFLISQSQDAQQIKIKTRNMHIFQSYLQEKNICRQQMIDYYFKTGYLASEEDVIGMEKCGKCDNCLRKDKIELLDITEDAIFIVETINNIYKQKGHTFGMQKTIKIIQKNRTGVKVSDTYIKEIIQILIGKQVLDLGKVGFGFILIFGEKNIKDILPLKARIQKQEILNTYAGAAYKNNDSLNKTLELRNSIAKKYNILPSEFINDMVIRNIDRKKPASLNELWNVDGISNKFIMTLQCADFIKEYVELIKSLNISKRSSPSKATKSKKSKKSKKPKRSTRDAVFDLYKQGKTLKEICDSFDLKAQTIEGHILYIFEHYDDEEINMEYFGLTPENETKIKTAIKKVGFEKLRPIKDIVGRNITYGQIKLCLLVMKIEELL